MTLSKPLDVPSAPGGVLHNKLGDDQKGRFFFGLKRFGVKEIWEVAS